MGLDAYIEPNFSRSRTEFEPVFAKVVEARDSYQGDDQRTKDALQAEVEQVHDLMFARNENYFRDSYNDSNVMRVLGVNFHPYLTAIGIDRDDGEDSHYEALRGAGLAAFIADVEASSVPPEIEDRDYFVDKRERLLRFLKRAQEANAFINMSY